MNQPSSEPEVGHPSMPVPAPIAPIVPSPLDLVVHELAALPANMREILLEALIKGCSFERRGKAWRLRTRVTTADGRRQKLSLKAGHDETYIKRLQEGIRMLREVARGPRQTPAEKAEQAAKKHRQAELRRLFIQVSHGDRGLKRDIFQTLIEHGLVDMGEIEARQVLWKAARMVSGHRPPTAADIMAISGANHPPPEDPTQKKYSQVPCVGIGPIILGAEATLEALDTLLTQQGQLSQPSSFAPASSQGDEAVQPAAPMTGVVTTEAGEPP